VDPQLLDPVAELGGPLALLVFFEKEEPGGFAADGAANPLGARWGKDGAGGGEVLAAGGDADDPGQPVVEGAVVDVHAALDGVLFESPVGKVAAGVLAEPFEQLGVAVGGVGEAGLHL